MLLSTTWTVTTLNDVVANDRVLSLREAINMAASGDKINFSPRLEGTIVLQNGELPIANKNLKINGPGDDILTVSGNDASRVFHITGGTVSFRGLTIADGNVNAIASSRGGGIRNESGAVTLTNCTVTGCTADYGGGIESSGSLTLSHCTLSSNTTSGGLNGGGVDINSGAGTIINCVFSGNHASSGGGVSIAGGTTLTLTNSTFDGNGSVNGGGVASGGTLNATGCTFLNTNVDYGGGVMNRGTATLLNCTISGNVGENGAGVRNAGTITLVGCTISGNSTHDYGGAGIHNSGNATLTNCTLSGNTDYSGYGGAAIRNSSGATLTLNDCTLSGNSAGYGPGGGIRTDLASTVLRNTIVSGNIGDSGHSGTTQPDDIAGTVDPSSSHNLIGVGGGLINGVNGNIVGVTDPKLGPLQDNGGPTWTMALLSGSPAINAGDNTMIPAGIYSDQCGRARTRGGTVDIGAYELKMR